MKNSGVFSKVRHTENGTRKTEEEEEEEKNNNFLCGPVCKRKEKKRRVDERKPLSLKLLSNSCSSVYSYYQVLLWVIMSETCCQCPQEFLLLQVFKFTSIFTYTYTLYRLECPIHLIDFPDLIGYCVSAFWF